MMKSPVYALGHSQDAVRANGTGGSRKAVFTAYHPLGSKRPSRDLPNFLFV